MLRDASCLALAATALLVGACASSTTKPSVSSSQSQLYSVPPLASGTPDEAKCADADIVNNISVEEYARRFADIGEALDKTRGVPADRVQQNRVAAESLALTGSSDLIAATPPEGQGKFAKEVCSDFFTVAFGGPKKITIPPTSVLSAGYAACNSLKSLPPDKRTQPDKSDPSQRIAAAAQQYLCPNL